MSRPNQYRARTRSIPVVEVPVRTLGQPTSAHHCDTLRTILREAGGDTSNLRNARKPELIRRVEALPRLRTHASTPAARTSSRRASNPARPTAPTTRTGISRSRRLSGRGQQHRGSGVEAAVTVNSGSTISVPAPQTAQETTTICENDGVSARTSLMPLPASSDSVYCDSDDELSTVSNHFVSDALNHEQACSDIEEESLFFPKPRDQACDTCMDEYPESYFPNMRQWPDCEHEQMPFCLHCLAQCIAAQVATSGFDDITCPHPDCQVRLSTEQVQAYADAKVRERHLNWINKRAIESTEQHLNCANTSCSFAGDVDRAMFSWMACPECQTRTCTECETPWHLGMSHDENMEAVRQEAAQQQFHRAQHESLPWVPETD